MDKLLVEGGNVLNGTIPISGAKNASLPILAATILTDEECRIKNVPDLKDVSTMIKILNALGRDARREGDTIIVSAGQIKNHIAPYELVSTMRASIVVLGPLLGRFGEAEVSFPGGCVIGPRPIDLHLKGLRALGVEIEVKSGYILANGKNLKGRKIYLGGHFGSSVLATDNVLMAAVFAEGETIIENSASEPEVEDLARFLIAMGADIKGAGTSTLKVRGVKSLRGTEYSVIPDRIEAGTYMIGALITNGRLYLEHARAEHNLALIDKLREAGGVIDEVDGGLEVYRAGDVINPIDITTLTYPGFPTDLQAQMMSLAAISNGISVITEKIYPDRFIHISELNRMGADIVIEGATAIVKGTNKLSGAPVMASDLRASAALVLAGLVASGQTEIARVYHLDRGYEKLEEKLSAVGAKIWRMKEIK
ncbi:UDP-N-acetylglucosamine 1-carboxyvinyltransferase [Candidatus Omnitrophus magneticus]|uniref:UDP-N-acetylglucosamine 1-carboxyvinyltransferase n=1 Tax=Candidatus Omnitrophus magneticus TaxID=1609969 RepID=A0A0F0CJ46_9BACT|nr:UDP-N-acetylglucosamine 1-carboxyvinyltransferase [Candidatus Omnitrophus magneticus]